jgi:tetratricopeptide (TPR) repeat protein
MKEYAPDAAGQIRQLRTERAARGEEPLPPAEEWCIVGHRLEAAGFHRGAADAWREALAATPAQPQAHLGLCRALLALGDGNGAAAAALDALDAHDTASDRGVEPLLDDPDEDPWYLLGLAEHLRGRLPEAVAAYAKSSATYPWFVEPILETARAELARGRADRAADAARRALHMLKGRPEMAGEVRSILDEAERRAKG